MTKIDLFNFNSHHAILLWKIEQAEGRGTKSKLAHAVNCQASYLSLVLKGKANLSLEQVEAACRHFAFNADETEFTLLLTQKDRAGTTYLKDHFAQKIDALKARRLLLVERVGKATSLTPDQQATYYSAWTYAAVHIALTIPELRTPGAIRAYLGVTMEQVMKALEFLESVGLCVKVGDEYQTTKNVVRLSKESNNIVKHHTNWRLRAIDSLERERDHEMHYSAVFSANRETALKLKDSMLEHIKTFLKDIQAADEKDLYVMCFDLFGMDGKNG